MDIFVKLAAILGFILACISLLWHVWIYHERIVEALERNDFDEGLTLLTEHFCLLPTVPVPANS